ncbi:uncharacterized protein LOC134085516 [Sardina pilchardus]|uniref:uncharacterized protein LOC134085516 n=1 Tax=Sardina pilchardus TaxID=27697 RepID=UPI002E0DBBE5
MSSKDVESLQPTVRKSSSKCIYLSLACAVVVTALVGAAAFVFAWTELNNKMDLLSKQINLLNSTQSTGRGHHGAAPYASLTGVDKFKSRHIAYLRVPDGNFRGSSMEWEAIRIGNSSSVGAMFDYDSVQHKLTVKREGSYFIYLNLKFSNRDLDCNMNGTVKVTLKSKDKVLLSCEVKLAECPTVTEKCWAVAQHLERDSTVIGDMFVHDKQSSWTLVSNESGFGMFLVDSP